MEYEKYKPPVRVMALWCAELMLLSCLIGKLFYGSFSVGLMGIAGIPFYVRSKAKQLCQRRKQELLVQFQDLIRSYSTALKAGYSVENAFKEAYADLKYLYEDKALIMMECARMVDRMKNGHGIDELMLDLGKRSGLEDITDFASVFSVAKKSGGNLGAMIADTTQRISEKLSVTEEIRLMFASKALDQRIMNLVPVGIMLYILLGNPDYFEPLYKNAAGIAIMTAALGLYAAAYFLARKIMDIRI
ncbi:MAG: type II secretion system F family protein [Lachnospiraceae bacterium]|nr:type II secretion system F family protein [Lachnospiraceae bacterium]